MSNQFLIDRDLERLQPLAPAGYSIGLHIRFSSPLIQFQGYDRSWIDHYSEQGFVLRDPVVAWGFSRSGWVRWSDPAVPDPFDIFGAAASFGLRFGLTVSCGPIRSRTIASFARGDREYTDAEAAMIEPVVQRLHALTEPPDQLTKAQVEALRCIAGGMRHAAAAERLGISASALKARIASARGRLMARTTAEAIQRAKDCRLI